MEYYTEEEPMSSINNESGVTDSQYDNEQEEGAEEEDFCRYRKEQIFADIDFDKHKTKIACTIG